MYRPEIITDKHGRTLVRRFSRVRIAEHYFAIIVFTILVLTGFPQKFYNVKWLSDLIPLFGGLDSTRYIHRVTGIIFSAHVSLHLLYIVVAAAFKRISLTLLPRWQDVLDAVNTFKFHFGYTRDMPKFPRFDFQQKLEYLAIVGGGVIMVVSGLALLFPTFFTQFFTGQIIPAARIMHSSEAFLALIVITVWHTYAAIFSPEVFPLDTTIFTGYIDKDDLWNLHQKEYDELFPDN